MIYIYIYIVDCHFILLFNTTDDIMGLFWLLLLTYDGNVMYVEYWWPLLLSFSMISRNLHGYYCNLSYLAALLMFCFMDGYYHCSF